MILIKVINSFKMIINKNKMILIIKYKNNKNKNLINYLNKINK